ncbi:hypothetical protein SAMN05216232_3086 [Virgibacillus subterraneus]|uniref:CN hydrolase domain-containing protein n=1 Tax=Virgibacillus subterraneus TaxID=621109 RepID=A0A1H9I8M2_9BACI|nr:hypothetical protein [Virgibacillus subterraneus]SEQ70892.1 hypothetical protein SAMN05216232_3086 [Virgibacillus subterraneus]
MKILIGQPKREKDLRQLETEIENNSSVDLILYPESYFQESYLEKVSQLAKTYNTVIVTGYKDKQDLDRVLIINNEGEVILERAKTPEEGELYTPSITEYNGITYGYLLCREVFQGLEGLKNEISLDIIFNPIGVGMFSEEQYSDWSGEAKKIAVQHKSLVLGASHADGSYRNCGFSIPIAYCFDENGEAILLSRDDTRTRILDTVTKTVEIIEYPVKTK